MHAAVRSLNDSPPLCATDGSFLEAFLKTYSSESQEAAEGAATDAARTPVPSLLADPVQRLPIDLAGDASGPVGEQPPFCSDDGGRLPLTLGIVIPPKEARTLAKSIPATPITPRGKLIRDRMIAAGQLQPHSAAETSATPAASEPHSTPTGGLECLQPTTSFAAAVAASPLPMRHQQATVTATSSTSSNSSNHSASSFGSELQHTSSLAAAVAASPLPQASRRAQRRNSAGSIAAVAKAEWIGEVLDTGGHNSHCLLVDLDNWP